MKRYKRNQVEEAIFETFGAKSARIDQLRFRFKRLLAADRNLRQRRKSRGENHRHYGFYSAKPQGSGVEVMFSGYEAFALLAAIMLLEHGLPQAGVVKIMRQVRRSLESAYAQTLKEDPAALFDEEAVMAGAKTGMIATDNVHPVFLAFATDSSSSVDNQIAGSPVAVCQGDAELMEFIKRNAIHGRVATIFEFVRLMHTLTANLSQTRAAKRGRVASLRYRNCAPNEKY
jgi:hypothetical protein